jgi:hypothetical protein
MAAVITLSKRITAAPLERISDQWDTADQQ